jgi:hypothetical protein
MNIFDRINNLQKQFKEKNIFEKIILLPKELKETIFSYVPTIVLTFLNKSYYLDNHIIIRKYIKQQNIENYIRKTVRQDNHFVFRQILNENINKWLNIKNYYYRNSIYSNYLIFLDSYCIDYESYYCKNLIIEIMEKLGLLKNQHKKKYIKYIRSIT